MNKFSIIALLFALTTNVGLGQNPSGPEKIVTSIHSDKTPALRNMKIILAGEKPRSWENNEVKNLTGKPRWFPKTKSGPVADPVVQRVPGNTPGQAPMINMDGVGDRGASPSDATGAVGINHYIQVVNCAFAVWDKAGNLVFGPVDTHTLWDGFDGPWVGTNDGDGMVLYDKMADRWLISQFSITQDTTRPYYQLIAVSQTGDPMGSWNRYAYSFDQFNDYPKFGIWPDGYYSTYNMYTKSNMGENDFLGSSVMVFDRKAMLAGDTAARGVYFNKDFLVSALPGDLDGPIPPVNTPNVIAGINNNLGTLALFEMTMDWENPGQSEMKRAASLEVAPYDWDYISVPQPRPDFKLDNIPVRHMFRLQHRYFGDYEVVMANQTVLYGAINAVRWYELRKYPSRGWLMYQQGTFSPDSLHRWMASIAMNGKGEIALGYSAGGSGKWASARFTGRTADDDPGIMSFAEAEPASGVRNSPFNNRWGDYSCMSVDPVNDETFWFTSQYSGMNAWKSNIVAFNLGNIPNPVIDAGGDTTICSLSRYNTNPDILNAKSFKWTTNGDGFLLYADERDAQYKPGRKDIANKKVDLILTAYGYTVGSVVIDTLHIGIVVCTGISEISLNDQVDVFPNPSPGVFSLNINGFDNQLVSIEIVNNQGRLLFKQQLNKIAGTCNKQIDLTQFPAGTYVVRILGKEKMVVKFLVKN
jgi:hypothetical protein